MLPDAFPPARTLDIRYSVDKTKMKTREYRRTWNVAVLHGLSSDYQYCSSTCNGISPTVSLHLLTSSRGDLTVS